MKKTTSATTFNNWTKQLSKLKRSKANFTIHNMAKGIKKSNNCARVNIGILLVNLPITDISEFAISVANIFADPIISTPLMSTSILYGGKLWYHENLMTDQKFAKFSPSKFLNINSEVSCECNTATSS